MVKGEVMYSVIEILHTKMGFTDLSKLTMESNLSKELAIDSLDKIHLIMELETEYDILIHDYQIAELETVEDLCNLIIKESDLKPIRIQ